MTNTIVARSHSVTSERARRRTKNRAIDDVAPQLASGWGRGGGGEPSPLVALGQTLDAVWKNICPSALE